MDKVVEQYDRIFENPESIKSKEELINIQKTFRVKIEKEYNKMVKVIDDMRNYKIICILFVLSYYWNVIAIGACVWFFDMALVETKKKSIFVWIASSFKQNAKEENGLLQQFVKKIIKQSL
jgi:hypothetical protein